jgi:hypothetical protein
MNESMLVIIQCVPKMSRPVERGLRNRFKYMMIKLKKSYGTL